MPKKPSTIKLNKIDIEALPPAQPGKRDTYHVRGITGLQLRVTPKGVKTFSLLKRVKGGQPERVTLYKYGEKPLEAVKVEALKAIADLAGGQSVASDLRASRGEATLSEVFDDFLRHKRNRRGAYLTEVTKRDYRSTFTVHLDKLKKRKLSEIKAADIERLHAKVGKVHKHRANRILALVSSIYNYAKAGRFYSGANPAEGIRKFPEDSRERFIRADELPRFFKAVAAEENDTIRDYVLLSLLTGARRSNVLSMRWADVNLARAEWCIPVTKGGFSQTVALSPEAVQILKTRKPKGGGDEFVFHGPGASGHLEEPKKGWQRILRRAGIDDLRLHDLRRTLGSWQAATGASLPVIGKSLNHKTPSTTAIYARLDLDPVRASVNTATAAMLEAAGVKKPSVTKRKKQMGGAQ